MPEVLLSPRAVRDLEDVPQGDLGRVRARILALALEPRPPSCLKLGGSFYRLRVGDWRVLYAVEDAAGRVVVLRVLRRSERTYRRWDG
ncbi:MAG: type II toxin-antitoxin system RelE/ParE family toxin [Elusimicrobia bacterium]|nr:type II toxin-antitoxin system RelE/ParE family toxin [Elusimicrobiota bacterium]